ncbi:hypothetical protein I6N96_13485 [Enterococcus sp. BWM-S5]|uniref:PLD phosphodiesterase domain-containing protein n=1 Tax=Enterococcus larvae TaxID=2794352 RepID=A0ABS4CMN7_9ENTE|nr:AAA domain-containing protein [Enterococcus larvae]MBP1047290.1 hypothetical protein [Enterococcus larvae]
MGKASNIINYFYEYDFYNSLLTTSIDKLTCKSLKLEDSSFLTFSNYMTQQKTKKLSEWLTEKKSIPKNRVDEIKLKNYLLGSSTLEQLLEEDILRNTKIYPDDKTLIEEIKANNEFYLFYPILINNEKNERPVLSFTCKIAEKNYEITDFVVNKEALIILLAAQLQQETLDVRNLYAEQIDDLIVATNAIEDVTDIEEFNRLFLDEFKNALGFQLNLVNTNVSDWHLAAQLKISCESLASISGSCFEDELKTLHSHIDKEEEQLPPLLRSYLFHNQEQVNLNTISLSESFHYGSYQSEYPVTSKQWELVNLLPKTDFLAIEGPPGTGKTTLLKEIIADTLVRKANRLLDVWDAEWQLDKKNIYRSPLGGKNLDSIILTSTNNKAINNIGLELIKEVPFFSEFAASLNDETINGTLCARLGKYENVKNFHQNFFVPFLKYLADAELAEGTEEKTIASFKITQQKLEEYNTFLNQFLLFKEQTAISNDKELNENKVRVQNEVKNAVKLAEENEHQLKNSQAQLDDLEKDITIISSSIKQNRQETDKNNEEKRKLFAAKEAFEKISPTTRFLCKLPVILSSTKELLSMYPSLDYISDLIKNINAALEKTSAQQTILEQRLLEKNAQLYTLKETITSKSDLKTQLLKEVRVKESVVKEFTTISEQIDNYSKNCDSGSLWESQAHVLKNSMYILKLREEMFHHSLKLLEVYIIKNKQFVLKNLEKVLSKDCMWFKCLYNGNKPYDDSRADLLRTLYETFFLCFPVVSTTLHSFRKQTFPMIENLFDLLLFDESGQIVSYYAAAPLYRARKAVFVGDTNQIEPIISVPERILQEKYTELLSEESYSSLCLNTTSAQSYAIKASNFYEERNQVKNAIVLNEHMRCEKSIMKFSNQYVYDNVLTFMKQDTTEGKLLDKNLLAFDIRGTKSTQHFNQAEIDACKRIVEALVEEHGEEVKKNIGIITPFSLQAKKIDSIFNKEIAVGTVHTFQGDEKKIIIFSSVVDNLNKNSNGLTKFIGNKANLLNVAFSRAKEQFIYVGNFDAAREAQNYLNNALQTIVEYGKTYSLFDSMTITEDNHDLKKIINILSGPSLTIQQSPITDYLHETIPENIVYGGKEHNELLMNLIRLAEKSITVVSPWISDYVVNEDFLQIIAKQLEQESTVKIFFGHKGKKRSPETEVDEIVNRDMPWNKDGAAKAITALSKLLKDDLIHNPPSHVKLLMIDNTYLFIGSLNWLMNSGKTEQKELSCLVTDKSSIDYVSQYYTE